MDVHGSAQGNVNRYKIIIIAIGLLASLQLSSQASAGGKNPFHLPVAPDEIKIMTYNALNLFDSEHDENKSDWTFLPKGHPLKAECANIKNNYYREACEKVDWTDQHVQLKLQQVKKAVGFQGSNPDLLAIEEIENENITRMLAKTIGYHNYLITESPDGRGIDVALLYNSDKLEYIEHAEVDTSVAVGYPSRNILRVHFRPKLGDRSAVIGVYVNHWPAQMTPPLKRFETARVLAQTIDAQTQRIGKEKYRVIVLGDLNMTETESPNAVDHMITNPFWTNHMVGVQEYSEVRGNPTRFKMPPASYWIGGRIESWRKFDQILVSPNLLDETTGMHIQFDSFRIVAPEEMTQKIRLPLHDEDFYPREIRVPQRHNPYTLDESQAGYSDHLPVVVKIKLNPVKTGK